MATVDGPMVIKAATKVALRPILSPKWPNKAAPNGLAKKANAKVANYPFTTLEPNLGVYYDLILADIPGLIEGASKGKGLGTKFLRHIERTKVLFHFISADSPNPLSDYKTVRHELENYGDILLGKQEHIFLSKSDLVDKKVVSATKKDFKKIKKEIVPISVIDPESIEAVKKILNTIAKDKKI